jgi:protein-tyrosine phosphatase
MARYSNCAIVLLTWLLITLSACQKAGNDTGSATIVVERSRRVELEGQSNFRDLGGYRTADGRVVKWGQVYRSGELHKLSGEDVAVLAGLGIRTAASFLTDEEVTTRGSDRLPADTRELPLPIASGNAEELTRVVNEARKTGDFSKLPPDANPNIHRLLVHEGREEYSTLIRDIMDPANRPMVFHCSHGVHRTGTAAAILLAALGVPRETIREDYLLSNTYRSEEVEYRLGALRKAAAATLGVPEQEVDMTNIRAFYILEAAYIDAAFDEIEREYGSVDNYLSEGLGLTHDDVQRLRDELLD